MTAKYLVKLLLEEKIDFCLSGTSRSEKKDNNIFYFNDDYYNKDILENLETSTHVLISIPPTTEEFILKYFSETLSQNKNLEWLGYLSSTSVYGDHQGNWVTEISDTKASTDTGLKRLRAEKKLLDTNFPVRIFRLSGIYSLERNIFRRLNDKKFKMINSKHQIFSRIHIEDIAQILLSSFQKSKPKDIFNVSDDYPCAYREVVKYACNLLSSKMPEQVSLEDIPEGKLKDFYQDSKQVSNQKIKLLGIKLKYPTYKEGLKSIFDQSN